MNIKTIVIIVVITLVIKISIRIIRILSRTSLHLLTYQIWYPINVY